MLRTKAIGTSVVGAALALSLLAGCGAQPAATTTEEPATTEQKTTTTTETTNQNASNASDSQTDATTNATNDGNTAPEQQVQDGLITPEDAQAAALEHALVTEAEVTGLHTNLEDDDAKMVYDVEFFVGTTEYSYEIDAVTGDIVSYDVDND